MEPKHVLVVDDDKRLTAFLADFLGNLGHQMHVASWGGEAIELVQKHQPALMLLDMRMPGMDGVEVLKTVKSLYPAVKVIVMTSYDEKYARLAKQYGAEAFFSKPLSLKELTEKVEALLSRNDPPDPSAPPLPAVDVVPQARILFVNAGPHASLLMVGALHCVGEGSLEDEVEDYADAGLYAWEEVSTRKEVLSKLEQWKPDFIFIAADWEGDDEGLVRIRHVTASDLISEMMRSKSAPKEIFLYGGSSPPDAKKGGTGTSVEEPHWDDFEIQAAKINRMLWEKCRKFGLMVKRPVGRPQRGGRES